MGSQPHAFSISLRRCAPLSNHLSGPIDLDEECVAELATTEVTAHAMQVVAPKLSAQSHACPSSAGRSRRDSKSGKRSPCRTIVVEGALPISNSTTDQLAWAVLRPGSGKSVETPSASLCSREPKKRQPVSIEQRVTKRLRALRGKRIVSSAEQKPSTSLHIMALQDKPCDGSLVVSHPDVLSRAVSQLDDSLGVPGLASAIVQEFVSVAGDTSQGKRALKTLQAALRSNADLLARVQTAGLSGVAALARQDPREWASKEMHEKRARWAEECFVEASHFAGQWGECPECGGRAIVEQGQSMNFKSAKQYAHWRCQELNCGKESHMKE